MKLQIRKADTLFRKYLLGLRNYTCARCGRRYPEDGCRGLHVSHYWGRSRENTRYDLDNCDLLCFGCHQLWGHGDQRGEYTNYMTKKLGQKGYDLLQVRAYTYKKRDDKLDEVILRELLNEHRRRC